MGPDRDHGFGLLERRPPVLRWVAFCLLLVACASGAPQSSSATDWRDVPPNVVIAGAARSFTVPPDQDLKEVPLPPEFGQYPPRQAALYRLFEKRLERVAFGIAGGKLTGDFKRGATYVLHLGFNSIVRNKYDLLCRAKVIHTSLGPPAGGVMDRMCTQILCPADFQSADRLLGGFQELQQFPQLFDSQELSGVQIGPPPPTAGNICGQCFGRDWGAATLPGCSVATPLAACWKPNGPGPTTLGQVENITNRPVVGAVNAVATHPTDANIVYIGAVNGGIWRTANARAANPTWQHQTDRAESLSIGVLQFDPTDSSHRTLVAGVGRFSSFGRDDGGGRIGLLRTTNGASWTPIDGGGTLRGLNVSGVAPRGNVLVLSANRADVAANVGVWRSPDDGATWARISGTAGSGLPAGPSFDLAGDPSNAARLYTNGGTQGIYLSTDTGATWTKVSNATMDGLLLNAGNVKIAVGTANNVYVGIVRARALAGIFRSGDGGTTWAQLDLPATTENGGAVFGIHPGTQGNTHFSLAADPTDANVVYIAGDRQPCFTESDGCNNSSVPRWPNALGARDFSGRVFRIDASLPAGKQVRPLTHGNTASRSAPHADSRRMAIDANGELIETDDGGVYRRTAPRTNTGDWFSMNGDMQVTEFHSIAWDSVGKTLIAGAQDTGTPQQTARTNVTWQSVSTGDGANVAIDDISTPGRSVRYSSSQYLGNFRREVYDAGNVRQSIVFPALATTAPDNDVSPHFYTPIRVNNVDGNRLVIGAANSVYESLNQGDTLTEIGAGIVVNTAHSSKPIAYGGVGNPDMLYVGSGRRVFIRHAAAPAPLTASTTYPGNGDIVDIAIDRSNPSTAFVADDARVFMTRDAGATWTEVTGNFGTLDPGTIRAMALSPAGLAVGTDRGVFRAAGPTFDVWEDFACGLPRVPVYQLQYNARDNVLVAGTLGRGAWVIFVR